ncbi:MAG: hypothetical protein WA082_04510 [Candidatus Moraniibacteriota bacterium]
MKIDDVKKAKEIMYPVGYSVYFLTDESGEIVYVGESARSAVQRISSHAYTKEYSRVFFIPCKTKEEMDILEATMIIAASPKYKRRIDNPAVLGLVGVTELKRMGHRTGAIINAVNDHKIKTVQVGTNSYFEKRIVDLI